MIQLKINKNLLRKIGLYLYPKETDLYKIRKLIEKRFSKATKIKDNYSGFCIGRYHFVEVNNEIVEFFIVKEVEESKHSIYYKNLMNDESYKKIISLKIETSNKNIWTSKHTKEINYRINKNSLAIYKRDIKPDCYIWTDGSLCVKNNGYSSYVISDLNNNVLHQDAIKMEKANNSNETEVFAIVLALNKIQEIGLIGPTLITDSHYAFIHIMDRNSKIRKNIDKVYGKEKVELMLTNFKNKNRLNNKAHNLLEDKSAIKKEISNEQMVSMGYILEGVSAGQKVKTLKTVSIPPKITTNLQTVTIPEVVSIPKSSKLKEAVMNNWFSKIFVRKNREIVRFEKRNKLKINPLLFKYLKGMYPNKSDKDMILWLEDFINKSVEFKENDKRYLVHQKKMITIWDNEIKFCEQRPKKIKSNIKSFTKKIVI